jgi:hypothetical protein
MSSAYGCPFKLGCFQSKKGFCPSWRGFYSRFRGAVFYFFDNPFHELFAVIDCIDERVSCHKESVLIVIIGMEEDLSWSQAIPGHSSPSHRSRWFGGVPVGRLTRLPSQQYRRRTCPWQRWRAGWRAIFPGTSCSDRTGRASARNTAGAITPVGAQAELGRKAVWRPTAASRAPASLRAEEPGARRAGFTSLGLG